MNNKPKEISAIENELQAWLKNRIKEKYICMLVTNTKDEKSSMTMVTPIIIANVEPTKDNFQLIHTMVQATGKANQDIITKICAINVLTPKPEEPKLEGTIYR